MSKETDIAISVAVKDGPKMQPEKTKLPKGCGGINLTKAINEELVIDCDNPKPSYKVSLTQDGLKLIFVAIHADRYKYKDACGVEQPGILYAVDSTKLKNGESEYLDGPHVYISRPLHPFAAAELHFSVCEAFFSCVTNRDKKKS